MKKFTNRYIFIYATVLVAVAAVVLTVVAVSLKPLQDRNREIEQKQMLLRSIGIESTVSNAESLYTANITEQTFADSLTYYTFNKGCIVPFRGTGLWGPIWGYIAFDKQCNIVGAVFDHKGETPGLGGEISTPKFAKQFIGKSIVEQGTLTPIVLKKHANHNSLHEVDAISGGTMTSNGMTKMLANGMDQYRGLFETLLSEDQNTASQDAVK